MPPRKKTRRRKDQGRLAALRERCAPASWGLAPGHLRAAAWFLLIAGIAVAWAIGVPKLRDRVATSARIDPAAIEIRFSPVPEWVEPELRERIDLLVRGAMSGDPLQRNDLVRAREALLECGWFASIGQVARVRDDAIFVQATWVERFAVVRDAQGDHLVDREGRLLPRSWPRGASGFPVVLGATSPRPARPGARWPGNDIDDALALLELVEGRDWTAQVAGVEVSRDDDPRVLTLVTDIGSRIIWGSVPGREQPMEMPATLKVAYLEKAFADSGTGRIDWNQRGNWHFLGDAMTHHGR